MDLRLSFAILIGKFISRLTQLTGTGATAAPGLYALKVDPHLVQKLSKKLKRGSIVVSGTNGKTTTSRLIADIISKDLQIIHNRQGSNLLRGIASILIKKSSIFGKIDSDWGIWETDEATLPEAIASISPKIIVLINLFRDQLDRYGEVDTTRAKWQKAIKSLPKQTLLVLNADDPGIAILAEYHKGTTLFFGVNDKKLDLPEINQVTDVSYCLRCGQKLTYEAILSAHVGHYSCPKCSFKRPTPDVSASKLTFQPNFSTSLTLSIHNSRFLLHYSLPGLYNVYNILAASSVASTLNIKHQTIKDAITGFSAVFGRFQKVKIGSKTVITFLIKNPAGANEVLRTIAKKYRLNILAVLNDNFADGRDVSWIWDTNWEILNNRTNRISVSGLRAWDLATRLKYADLRLSKNNIYKEVSYSVKWSIRNTSNYDTLLILPTYTALLEVQKTLSKLGNQTKWHKQ